jgi:hypothetical protein
MTTKYLTLLLAATLTTSCGWKPSSSDAADAVNTSALYDPSVITLTKGKTYQFEEGQVVGRGQKFHSHYRYLRAITIGQ